MLKEKMLLAIDIGNTEIKLALYSNAELYHTFSMITKEERTHDEIGIMILDFLLYKDLPKDIIKAIIVASVVPRLNDAITRACTQYFDIEPAFVFAGGNSNLKIPLDIKIDHPPSLGADRVATSVGGIARYKNNLIILNFGTATVCEVIDSKGAYIGGTIAPGVNTSIRTLHNSTSLLPMYHFCKPTKIIATSTEDALHSGVFYGTIGSVEKTITEIKKELKEEKVKVIATGGLAKIVSKHTNLIDKVDDDLTTFGLYKIYSYNKS